MFYLKASSSASGTPPKNRGELMRDLKSLTGKDISELKAMEQDKFLMLVPDLIRMCKYPNLFKVECYVRYVSIKILISFRCLLFRKWLPFIRFY